MCGDSVVVAVAVAVLESAAAVAAVAVVAVTAVVVTVAMVAIWRIERGCNGDERKKERVSHAKERVRER